MIVSTVYTDTINVNAAVFERAKALLKYDNMLDCPVELNAKECETIYIGKAGFDNGDSIEIMVCSGQMNYYDKAILSNEKFGQIVDFKSLFELSDKLTYEFSYGDKLITYKITINLIQGETKMKENEILFAKVREGAQIPSKSAENAGYDVYACFDDDFIKIPANTTKMVPTGIASALPLKYYFQIEERGSTGSKGIKKSAGVIDSGYRGEWFIAITNSNNKDLYVAKKGIVGKLEDAANTLGIEIIIHPYEKGIAQAVLQEVPDVIEVEIAYDELKEIKSERGAGALGSSGK